MNALSTLPILMWLSWSSGMPPEKERLVPEFDLGKIKASYVVSLPANYDKAKSWPVLLDFHGAIAPDKKGAVVTRDRLWSKFVKDSPWIVVGINSRTRSWNQTAGAKDDQAYAHRVLAEVAKNYAIDAKRVYLAGFSSGADFLCSGGLPLDPAFGGSLVVCPGPPNVVGLKSGALLKAKGKPFYLTTGEEDFIRKNGAWQAFLALDKLGSPVMYREVPRVAHAFFPVEEYGRLLDYLEYLAGKQKRDDLTIAKEAIAREDFLLASTHLLRLKNSKDAKALLEEVEKRGQAYLRIAKGIDAAKEPGRAYAAWWHLRTQFHRFDKLASQAQQELDGFAKKMSNAELLRAQGDWFRQRGKINPPVKGTTDEPAKGKPQANKGLWAFDHYLNYKELREHLHDLAKRYPHRAKLVSIGKSIQGRDIWALEITDFTSGSSKDRPAVYMQGAIHGNEASSTMTVLYMAYQFAANPNKSRAIDRTMQTSTLYAVPAVNPDAVHHFYAEPHTHWRPRYNYRPFDSDGDGKVDEDPYEDLNGDGEIGLMYQPDPKGPYVLKDGKLVRGKGNPTYKLIGPEGIDNDGDGKFSEDQVGGVDLNRNFPVGFRSQKSFGGTSGPKAASEPETKAILDFVAKRNNIAMFLDYHNDASCLFYWTPEDYKDDLPHYQALAERATTLLGYPPKPLHHSGAGLAIAWAYGQLGVPAFIVELEATRGDPATYYDTVWQAKAFLPARPFKHPQLGNILIGNDYAKLAKRNPHPKDIVWLGERNLAWLKEVFTQIPRIEIQDPRILLKKDKYEVTGRIVNTGQLPTSFAMRNRVKQPTAIELSIDGVALTGKTTFLGLPGGEAHAFRVEFDNPREPVTLVASHASAGTVRLPVIRAASPTTAIRKDYRIQPGFATPDTAIVANNQFIRKGVPIVEMGPAFKLTHRKPELRIGVILAEWKDHRHKIDAREFEKAFFSEKSYTGLSATGQPTYGSVRDFFAEMSYGKLRVMGKIFDWIELPGRYADHRDASFGSRTLAEKMIQAIRQRDGEDALARFDCLAFIWAGNRVARTSALWPMRITLPDAPEMLAFKMAEFDNGEMTIGVACHEMGHTFGVADKYGLGATDNPLGQWCLMGKGTHGGGPTGRHRPFHMCAWCKMVIGWLKPTIIDPARPQKLALRPSLHGPGEAFRILLKPDGSEYLLLENRRCEGFHTDLPSPGLSVLLVGPNTLPAFPQKRVQLLPAHGLPTQTRGVLAQPELVAWPQTGKAELTIAGVRIWNIRLIDDVVYFEVGPALKG